MGFRLLFFISLFLLWVTFNALFMLPGQWDAFLVSMAAFSAVSAFLISIRSGKLLLPASRNSRSRADRSVFSTFPVVFCGCAIVLLVGTRLLLGIH
jgi:hypothetical protein